MLRSLHLHLHQNPKPLLRHLTTTTTTTTTKDDYFSAIHHITNIVRRDHFLERTLNKLHIPTTNSPSQSPPSASSSNSTANTATSTRLSSSSTKSLNCPRSVQVYNSLLFSLCQSNLFHGAYSLVRRMVRKGLAPNKETYSILVNAWCSNGKMKEAQLFLEEMSEKGYNPPLRGRDLLVEGLINAGYIEGAKDMVKENCVPIGNRSLLQKTSRASAVALNAVMCWTKARLHKEHPKLQTLAVKKVGLQCFNQFYYPASS